MAEGQFPDGVSRGVIVGGNGKLRAQGTFKTGQAAETGNGPFRPLL